MELGLFKMLPEEISNTIFKFVSHPTADLIKARRRELYYLDRCASERFATEDEYFEYKNDFPLDDNPFNNDFIFRLFPWCCHNCNHLTMHPGFTTIPSDDRTLCRKCANESEYNYYHCDRCNAYIGTCQCYAISRSDSSDESDVSDDSD